jgi:hypothetical protein
MSEQIQSLRRQINRCLRSEVDFREAETYAMRIASAGDQEIKRALTIATIICYARPFSRNERDGNAEAEPNISFAPQEGLSAAERGLHDLIIKLRNKAVAHSEHSFNPAYWVAGSERHISYHAPEYEFEKAIKSPADLVTLCRKMKKRSMDLSFKLNERLAKLENAS